MIAGSIDNLRLYVFTAAQIIQVASPILFGWSRQFGTVWADKEIRQCDDSAHAFCFSPPPPPTVNADIGVSFGGSVQ